MPGMNRKRILNIIRMDLMTMNGGKNSLKTTAVIMFVICAFLVFCLSPLASIDAPLMMGAFFVPMLFQNELKYHSDKMPCLLPISRKDLVRARFILVAAAYLGVSILFYLLVLLAAKIKLYYLLGGEEVDVIAIFVKLSGGKFTEIGLINLFYFAGFTFGFMVASASLRKYFRNKESISNSISLKAITKNDIVGLCFLLAVSLLFVLTITDVLPLAKMLPPLLQLMVQLAEVANGFLLLAVLLTWSVCNVLYKYVSALVEYERKDL